MFLITPFADLALAQVLRTPIFACSDADLMLIWQKRLGSRIGTGRSESWCRGFALNPQYPDPRSSWWQRLQHLARSPSPALQRATELLQRWLALADKLPVHDLLDRIYFEGDVLARYTAVLPPEMRAKVTANLHAFMEIALERRCRTLPQPAALPAGAARIARQQRRCAGRRQARHGGRCGAHLHRARIERAGSAHRLAAGCERGKEEQGRQRRAAGLADRTSRSRCTSPCTPTRPRAARNARRCSSRMPPNRPAKK